MKNETSEKLYTEFAHILACAFVTFPLSLFGAVGSASIMFAFSGFAMENYWTLIGWTLLLFVFFDALFQCVASFAPDAQQAQTIATPLLVIFVLFNGIVVNKGTAPTYLRWIFDVCPSSYGVQAMVIRIAEGVGDTSTLVIDHFGFEAGHGGGGLLPGGVGGVLPHLHAHLDPPDGLHQG